MLKVVQNKQVISRGTCWDLKNVATDLRKRIVGKKKVSHDMITVTVMQKLNSLQWFLIGI